MDLKMLNQNGLIQKVMQILVIYYSVLIITVVKIIKNI